MKAHTGVQLKRLFIAGRWTILVARVNRETALLALVTSSVTVISPAYSTVHSTSARYYLVTRSQVQQQFAQRCYLTSSQRNRHQRCDVALKAAIKSSFTRLACWTA